MLIHYSCSNNNKSLSRDKACGTCLNSLMVHMEMMMCWLIKGKERGCVVTIGVVFIVSSSCFSSVSSLLLPTSYSSLHTSYMSPLLPFPLLCGQCVGLSIGVNPSGVFNHAVADPLGKYSSTKWLSIITAKYP